MVLIPIRLAAAVRLPVYESRGVPVIYCHSIGIPFSASRCIHLDASMPQVMGRMVWNAIGLLVHSWRFHSLTIPFGTLQRSWDRCQIQCGEAVERVMVLRYNLPYGFKGHHLFLRLRNFRLTSYQWRRWSIMGGSEYGPCAGRSCTTR